VDISVIIVNYNVRQFLENALTSVQRALEGIAGEIIVVDNASEDGSAEMVRAKFPHVRLFPQEKNFGFARANNVGIAQARGRYFLLLNPDTVVQENTIRTMVKFCDEHPRAGLAGCKILNPDGSFQLPCRRSFPTPWVALTKTFGLSAMFPRSRLFGRYNLTYLDPEATYEVDAISGSFMMIRREAFERVGGLDESFFMYGEDLDYCYRIRSAGFAVYYVHATAIIHYKGESTRRSSINELRVFYQAMVLFVEKHYRRSAILRAVLYAGIQVRGAIARLGRASIPISIAFVDAALVLAALALGEELYFGKLFKFPSYAYPTAWIVPIGIVVLTMMFSGLYGKRRQAVARAAGAVLVAYVLISALVFFVKAYAFSRAVVLISGALCVVFLPSWRWLLRRRVWGAQQPGMRKSLFGRRTVIVGTGEPAQTVLRKLRARVSDGYNVVGFVDKGGGRIGDKIVGLEVLGSLETIGKVIDEHRVGEVIFSTDGLSYADILAAIGRSSARGVNFRLVPRSLESIVGKTHIDSLDTVPLVDIEYNIHRTANRFLKRVFDIGAASVALAILYLPVRLVVAAKGSDRVGVFAKLILRMPEVLAGRISIVGLPPDKPGATGMNGRAEVQYLGPHGLTGLVQINERDGLEEEEREQYALYYAKHQSLLLDLEIVLKTMLPHDKN
jgi:O-antigen biosynthesis protein